MNFKTKPKPSKYRNKPVRIDGIWFASILEGSRYGELKLLKRAGEIMDFKRQVEYKLEVNGIHVTAYRADFVVTLLDGTKRVEDTKGFLTPEYEIKRALMLAIHGIEIYEIKKR